jgi:hypothetical protein
LKTCLKTLVFYQDILFFEKEFDGIMPEITVDTKRKKGNETLYLEKDG